MLSTNSAKNPPEMERLLRKYSGGNLPPLISSGKSEVLLSDEGEALLKIVMKGFSETYNIPLNIFPLSDSTRSSSQENTLSDDNIRNLLTSCKYLKKDKSESCKYCLEKQILTMQNNKAYMCYAGMISFATPVYLFDRVIAIISSDCRKPKEGYIWSPGLEKPEGKASGEALDGLDITAKIGFWQESKRRIRECEKILGLKPDELLNNIIENTKEISPGEPGKIIEMLEKTSKHLTEMINKTYKLEKEKIIGWIRAELACALSSIDTFWTEVQRCLENLARLIGIDYIILITHNETIGYPFHLQCQCGLPQDLLPSLQYNWAESKDRVKSFVAEMKKMDCLQEIDLRQYRDMPILGALYSFYGKGGSYPALIASAIISNGGLTCMLLGKTNPVLNRQALEKLEQRDASQALEEIDGNHRMDQSLYVPAVEWLNKDDQNHLKSVASQIAIITRVWHSIKRMQDVKEEQAIFMESVAHELRTPITNIMIAADNLRNARMSPERVSPTIEGILTQLERLNLLADKAWMFEQLRSDSLAYNNRTVDIYKTITECKYLMSDLAESKSIEIDIDPKIKSWKPIQIDAEKFKLSVINLIQNGIKYSFNKTSIQISGTDNTGGMGVFMIFTNEGIPIRNEEKDRIFERYFRTREAIKMDPAGSGIGLTLVKEFVEHYKGKIGVESTEIGFGRYQNVFSLFLPRR